MIRKDRRKSLTERPPTQELRSQVESNELRFRTLIEQSADAIQLVDRRGRVLYSSDSVKRVTGFTPKEIEGEGPASRLHPDDLPGFLAKMQQLLEHPDEPQTMQYRVRHKNGEWIWLETTGTNHLDTPGINALVGNFRNITARKEAEEKLRQSEEQKEFLLALTDVFRKLTSPREIQKEAARMLGEYLDVNRVYYVGVESDGHHLNIYNHHQVNSPSAAGRYDLNDYGPKLKADYRSGRTIVINDVRTDDRVPKKMKKHWEARSTRALVSAPIIKKGNFVAAFSMDQTTPREWASLDIALLETVAERTWLASEQAKIETELKDSQEELATITAAAPVALWMTNSKAEMTFVNQAWCDWTGRPFEDHIGRVWTRFLANEDSRKKAAQLRAAVKHMRDYRDEFLMIDKDGRRRWLDVIGRPFYDKSGKFAGYTGSAADITERRADQVHLRESQERLELAEQAGNIGSFEWNVQDNRIIWSLEQERLYGLAPGSFDGKSKTWRKLIHPDDYKTVESQMRRVLAEHGTLETEWRIIRPDGEKRVIAARAQLFYDENGKPERLIGTNMDITERKRYEHQKDEFIAIASHELKTPVTSMKMYAAVLERRFRRSGDEVAAKSVSEIDGQLDRLNALIHDLLDVTKIEAGHLRLHQSKFRYDELVKEVVSTIQLTTDEHHINVIGLRKLELYSDRDRLAQVLTNLLENAIKYSPTNPEIKVTISSTKDNLTTCVIDKGIGIQKDLQKHLFERFNRIEVEDKNAANYPGLGLGLYISAQIIDRLGGRIWCESKYRQGSKFYFSVPRVPDQGRMAIK